MDKIDQLLSIHEVASLLNVSEKTIRRHIQSGKLISNKIGGVHRIKKSHLDLFLNPPKKLIISDLKIKTPPSFPRPNHEPEGPLDKKWSSHKSKIRLVNPANKRLIDVIVVGSGLAGGAGSASLAELGYNVKTFCFQDSPRRAHSIAAQGGINAAKNYQGDGDSTYRLFYDTVKGGDYRSREANVYRLAEV